MDKVFDLRAFLTDELKLSREAATIGQTASTRFLVL